MADFTIQTAFSQALQLHQSGSLREAERLYQQILERQPAHAGAMHFLGVLAHQEGRHAAAVDLIRGASAIKPDWPEVHNNLGLALKDNGQLDEAITAYRNALALRPDYAVALSNLSAVLETKLQHDQAMAAYRKFIVLTHHLSDARIRCRQLMQSIAAAFAKPVTRFAFIPSTECDWLHYFPDGDAQDIQVGLGPTLHQARYPQDLASADILILTGHGADLSPFIAELRRQISRDALVAVWLWDNHWSRVNNLRTAMAADFIFPSHRFAANYLACPRSVLAGHMPSCCAQWTREEAAAYFEQRVALPRSDRLLLNYVVYDVSSRSRLLEQLKAEMPQANVLLMDRNDRSRYFDKSRADRFGEWMAHKATLILPVDRDLSTRVFDALLAGEVLLVPTTILDFDKVIPPARQEELGIIKLPSLDIDTIREAATLAVRIFDEKGVEGARARHRYVLDNHMTVHRVAAILHAMKEIARGRFAVDFDQRLANPFGLYVRAV